MDRQAHFAHVRPRSVTSAPTHLTAQRQHDLGTFPKTSQNNPLVLHMKALAGSDLANFIVVRGCSTETALLHI